MAQPSLHQSTSQSPTVPEPRLFGALTVLSGLLAVWYARLKQRQDLAELDPRLLRDIGVSRAEAAREAEKPFWRA